MTWHLSYWLIGIAAIVGGWWVFRSVLRKSEREELTNLERRIDRTLRRFQVRIDYFKLAPRRVVSILLNHDHAIAATIDARVRRTGESREELRLVVQRYVDEIVPSFKPLAYHKLGSWVAGIVLRSLYRVDYDASEVAHIKKHCQDRKQTMVYLMNHRSNVDYVVAPYVLKDNVALSFAVGEWARIWPLEYIFKSFGSYFLRRGFRDPLYHTVLRRYVQLITKNAVTQALFPEGALSRDGKLRPAKIGLVDYILSSKEDRSFLQDLVFVPVGINYDRVLEDRVLTSELVEPKPNVTKTQMLRRVMQILFGNLNKFYRRKLRKNGIAAIRFGEPCSFDDWHAARGVDIFSLPTEQRRGHVVAFCDAMFEEIANQIPVTPLCLVARVLLESGPISQEELVVRVEEEIQGLMARDINVVEPERGAAWMVEGALLRFELRRLIIEEAGRYAVAPGQQTVVGYYANSIAHYYGEKVPIVEKPSYAG